MSQKKLTPPPMVYSISVAVLLSNMVHIVDLEPKSGASRNKSIDHFLIVKSYSNKRISQAETTF